MSVDLNWLISRHKARGERLTPWPKESTAATDWDKERERKKTGESVGGTPTPPRQGFGKDFENSDYQYFASYVPQAEYTTCRACDIAVRNVKSTRKAHLQKGCSMFVRELMERCGKLKLCVMCGASAKSSCWGFWFCSRNCTKKWETGVTLAVWAMQEKLAIIRKGKWRPKT